MVVSPAFRGAGSSATSAGFHSQNAPALDTGPTIEGGFAVAPVGDNACIIVHYEQYVLVWWLVPLRRLLARYLRWSMKKELRTLRDLVLAERRLTRRPAGAPAPPVYDHAYASRRLLPGRGG